jgi:hypothetical protein
MKISLALVVHGFGKVIFSDYYDVIYEWDTEAAKIEGMLQLANRLKREAMALGRIHRAKQELADPNYVAEPSPEVKYLPKDPLFKKKDEPK